MQMHMIMCVYVIQGETGLLKRIELRTNFPFQLAAHLPHKEISETGTHQIRIEHPRAIDEVRDLFRRKNRPAAHHDDMETHAEPIELMRPDNCIFRGVRPDHQAGRGQNAIFEGFFYSLVSGH